MLWMEWWLSTVACNAWQAVCGGVEAVRHVVHADGRPWHLWPAQVPARRGAKSGKESKPNHSYKCSVLLEVVNIKFIYLCTGQGHLVPLGKF